jgi:hypothetical protein
MAHEAVFERLKRILAPYAGRLAVTADTPALFQLDRPGASGTGGFVAAVRDGKAYASFHFMPVYAFPDLMAEASPELRRRMQGKSCFNFTRVDEGLFAELEALTERGLDRYAGLDPIALRAEAAAKRRT